MQIDVILNEKTELKILTLTCLMTVGSSIVLAPDIIEALGWSSASIDGTTYTSGTHSLPIGWSCEIVDTNTTKFIASRSKSIKRNEAELINYTAGFGSLKYRIEATQTINSQKNPVFSFTNVAHVTADGNVMFNPYTASASSKYSGASRTATQAGTGETSLFDTKNEKLSVRLPTSGWSNDGTYNILVFNLTDTYSAQSAGCFLFGSGSGSNSTAANAAGTSMRKVIPSGLSTGYITFVSGTSNSVTNSMKCTITPLDSEDTPETIGCDWLAGYNEFSFSIADWAAGDYELCFKSKGTLKKKLSIAHDPEGNVDGLTVTLKYGDLNGDNYVSATEVSYIYSKIGVSIGDDPIAWSGGITFLGQPYTIDQADFNGDFAITQADYDLASANSGQYGD